MDAPKEVTVSVSSVPSTAGVAVLRSVREIFEFQAHAMFLATTCQQIRSRGIKPMRQPSIVRARERPAPATFDVFQVFNTQHFDIRPVKLLDRLTNQILSFFVSMFWRLLKARIR